MILFASEILRFLDSVGRCIYIYVNLGVSLDLQIWYSQNEKTELANSPQQKPNLHPGPAQREINKLKMLPTCNWALQKKQVKPLTCGTLTSCTDFMFRRNSFIGAWLFSRSCVFVPRKDSEEPLIMRCIQQKSNQEKNWAAHGAQTLPYQRTCYKLQRCALETWLSRLT